MLDATATINDLKQRMRTLVQERDWEQFHSPKNISMALSVEAAELMEIFQFVGSAQSQRRLEQKRGEVEQEIADIASYIMSLCTFYDIDLASAFERKMQENEQRYTTEKSAALTKELTSL